MIVLCKRIFIIFLSLFLLIPANVYADTDTISAGYCVAIDMVTGAVLYERNKDERTSMASTTKIMTCIIALQQGNLDDEVIITAEMLDKTEGTLIYLKPGDTITLLDLIKGALLASGNDAANSIALTISESIEDFAELMNDFAEKIGMNNTHFETPSGLDSENHYSTAYDMALLTSYALSNDIFKQICSMQSCEITINNEKQKIYNHNKLLSRDESCIGVKTGFTKKSGRCLVSAFDYKMNTIIIVTLNAPDDWNDHTKILDFCKKKYRLYSQNLTYTLSVAGASKDSIDCVADYDVSYINNIGIKAYYYPILYAPVLAGDKVGKIEIYSNNKLMGTVDIIAPESVKVWQTTN